MEALQGACKDEMKDRQLEAMSLCGEPWPTLGSEVPGGAGETLLCSEERRVWTQRVQGQGPMVEQWASLEE